ncbi:MAG: LiaF-related protein [bacterium]|nr:LiaF-related protein [bacterium]
MNKISNLVWGLLFITVGVIFGLNALDITNINIFFDGWWTLFIIVPCFIGLFKDEDKSSNLIGLIIGLCLLLGCIDILKFTLIWKLMIPAILVMIGLSFIFKGTLNSKIRKEIKKLNKAETKEYCSCFSGQTIEFNNEEFMGCSISAVFGSAKCDLRNAIINSDVVINANSIFGGIKIYVPENVNVKINSTCIFGGVSDERKSKSKDKKHTIYVDASSIFGGVEIK